MKHSKEHMIKIGRKGGLKKNPKKGFGSNKELARKMGKQRANEKNQTL